MLRCFAFRVVNVDPKFLQRDDTLLGEPSVRHPCVSAERTRESPVAFAAESRKNGRTLAGSQLDQLANSVSRTTPHLPITRPHAAAKPFVQRRQNGVILGQTEVPQSLQQVHSQAIRSHPMQAKRGTQTPAVRKIGIVQTRSVTDNS